MRIDVQTNFKDVAKQINELHSDVATKATARALNSVMAQAKTAMSREIRAKFVLSAAKVNESLKINKAVAKGGLFEMEASLESPSQRGRSLNLINFGARQTKKGVSIKISRDGGRKLIPGAFIGNGGRTVFKREGKARLPIKALQTIDVAQMFNVKTINKAVVDAINDRFPVIFDREVKFYTEKFNQRRTG
ncbi:phage tail protein [Undibacterium macrobrachii]|uniref:Phage tail protein n=1 Tax=Undibacterium macrobrachii TaxID=1119058 RepID=A0ABQ2X703_9BURK|nr:phage tail protein [Undibacterium macrobrachii]GGX01509.1 hypothetical protein GCM10011282_04300 [Undibacterium macrobrachii]